MPSLAAALLVSAFAKIGHDHTDDKLRKSLSRLSQKTVDEVHAAVGRSELAVADVVRAVVPDAVLAQPAN